MTTTEAFSCSVKGLPARIRGNRREKKTLVHLGMEGASGGEPALKETLQGARRERGS